MGKKRKEKREILIEHWISEPNHDLNIINHHASRSRKQRRPTLKK